MQKTFIHTGIKNVIAQSGMGGSDTHDTFRLKHDGRDVKKYRLPKWKGLLATIDQ
jgi:hypothetical protein